jgi:hypothetical protein
MKANTDRVTERRAFLLGRFNDRHYPEGNTMTDTEIKIDDATDEDPDASDEVAVSAAKAGRSEALAASRLAKLEALFKDKHYRVMTTVALKGDARFVTPLGNKGRNGFAVQRVDEAGNDILHSDDDTPAQFIMGATLLNLVHEKYGSIEIPEKIRKRRTAEQKAQDDAIKAAQKIERQHLRELAKIEKKAAADAAKAQKVVEKMAALQHKAKAQTAAEAATAAILKLALTATGPVTEVPDFDASDIPAVEATSEIPEPTVDEFEVSDEAEVDEASPDDSLESAAAEPVTIDLDTESSSVPSDEADALSELEQIANL